MPFWMDRDLTEVLARDCVKTILPLCTSADVWAPNHLLPPFLLQPASAGPSAHARGMRAWWSSAHGCRRTRRSSPSVDPCTSPCHAGGTTAWPLRVPVTALVPTPARTAWWARDGGRRRAQIPRQEEAAGSRVGSRAAQINSEARFDSSHHGDGPRLPPALVALHSPLSRGRAGLASREIWPPAAPVGGARVEVIFNLGPSRSLLEPLALGASHTWSGRSHGWRERVPPRPQPGQPWPAARAPPGAATAGGVELSPGHTRSMGRAQACTGSMLPYTLHGTQSVTLHLVNSRTIRLSKRTKKKRITRD
jgi:hypothetical protein